MSEETSLLLRALTTQALSHQQEQGKAVKFCFFLNFLGLGFSKPSQRVLPPTHGIHGVPAPSKALYPNHSPGRVAPRLGLSVRARSS